MKLLLAIPFLFSIVFGAVQNFNVNTAKSNIDWTGRKVTGAHTGTVKLSQGTLAMDNGKLVGGSFSIDMRSMVCTDLSGEMATKLVGHLSSEDFFGTEKYPTAKFEITRAIAQDTKGNYKVIGNLTIKDTTKEIKFFATVTESASDYTASGKIVVDRSEFNIRYGSGSFFDNLGDKTIYDEFELMVNLVASK